MKNKNILIVAILSLAIGFAAAYLLFGKSQVDHQIMDSHNHGGDNNQEKVEEQIWTCSMHPQVRQNEPGLCPICEMDLIPLEKNLSDDPLVLQMTEASVNMSNIQTSIIGTSSTDGDKLIRLSGKIKADERLASSQVTHVPGRIEKLFVSFTGETVSKGQKLAEIYSPDLIAAQGELLEALKLIDLNPSLLEAARNKLRYLKIGDATIKDIEEKGEVKEIFTLYASESGIVSNRRISVGDYLKKGETLFDLMNLRKVWVLFDAYEEDLANIKVGNKIEFTTPSLSDKTFISKVNFINPVIDPDTRVATIRVEINNPYGNLKPEMFVNGVLFSTSGKSKNQITLPKSAVLWTGKRSVVYVKIPDKTIPSFQYREVELGDRVGDNYQILSGIDEGEEVVTYGSFVIDAAAQLNNQASMMNKFVKLKNEKIIETPNFKEESPIQFKEQIKLLTDSYIQLKDAFVATDPLTTTVKANDLIKNLELVNMNLVKGEAHIYWMEQQMAIESHGKKMIEIENIEDQRQQFEFLSEAIINTNKAFGSLNDTLYVQHCPMAFSNKGADWLSEERIIQNPYFGNKMLKCGTVKSTISND